MKGDDLLVFSEFDVEKYKLEGKTHNQTSHSIKHLAEYDEDFVEAELERARNIIRRYLKQNPSCFCRIWNRSTNTYYPYKHLDALEYASDETLLNTFDMINDKVTLRKETNEIENKLAPVLKALSLKYHNIINKLVDSAANLNTNKSTEEFVNDIKNIM